MNQLSYGSVVLCIFLWSGTSALSPAGTSVTRVNGDDEVTEIESVLRRQDKSWNRGDIEGFMETYWKSDELTFCGGGETARGWQATLARYKKNYPREKMGKLHFDDLEISMLGSTNALVLGKWHLNIHGQKKDGNFSLVMRKFDSGWKIVHDHSSTLETEEGWLSVEQAEVVGKL